MSELASEEIGSAEVWKVLDPTGGDIDLVAEGGIGRRCRWFIPLVAGSIVAVKADDTEETIPAAAPVGQFYGAQAKTLKATGTCTEIFVGW